jgi:hypothetical protein
MMAAAPLSAKQAPLLAAALIAFVAASAGITIAVWHANALPDVLARSVSLVFFLFIVPAEVLVHEGGHLAVAKLLGWRVSLLSWGPFTLRFVPLKLVYGAPAFGSSAAGAVVAVPPAGRESNWGWALLSAGGPLANFLLAGAAGMASAAASDTPRALFLVLAVISLASGLYNLWPRGSSDGAQLLNVLRFKNGDWRGLFARLVEQTLRGVRPRDWPDSLMVAVRRLSLWSDSPDLQLAAYAWHLDRGEIGPARAALARSARDPQVFAEQAFAAAWFDRNAAAAGALLARTGWSSHSLICYWRARAAQALITGETTAAREALRKGRILVREGPFATAFDADWFDAIEKELP